MKSQNFFLAIFIMVICILSSGCMTQNIGPFSDNGSAKPVITITPADEKLPEMRTTPESVQKRVMTPDTPASAQLKGLYGRNIPSVHQSVYEYQIIRPGS